MEVFVARNLIKQKQLQILIGSDYHESCWCGPHWVLCWRGEDTGARITPYAMRARRERSVCDGNGPSPESQSPGLSGDGGWCK